MVAGEYLTVGKIADILEMLDDGQWHFLDDIRQKMRMSKSQLRQIMAFLKEYEFVAIDEVRESIKLEDCVRKFLDPNATP